MVYLGLPIKNCKFSMAVYPDIINQQAFNLAWKTWQSEDATKRPHGREAKKPLTERRVFQE